MELTNRDERPLFGDLERLREEISKRTSLPSLGYVSSHLSNRGAAYNAPVPTTTSLPRVIAMLLIPPMLGSGFVLFSSGSFVWFNREHVVSGYLVCGAIFLAAGITMLAASFGILGSAGRWRFPVQAGSAAMFLSGVATFGGIATKVIPCEGPT